MSNEKPLSAPYHCRGLSVCSECGWLLGSVDVRGALRMQHCDCTEKVEPRWPGYDFNHAAQLCHCCGQVLLPSGSKYSVWFCRGCKKQVLQLNDRLGFYAVPIGPHSVFAGSLLRGNASGPQIADFVELHNQGLGGMRRLHQWAGLVVRLVIEERWEDPGDRIPIADYLELCITSDRERMRRLWEMVAFMGVEGVMVGRYS